MWGMERQKILSFLLISEYEVLLTPINLTMWKLIKNPGCKLCGKPANLEHVVSSCRTALKDVRYTWRHDQVRREIAAVIDTQWRKKTMIAKGPSLSTVSKNVESLPETNTARQVISQQQKMTERCKPTFGERPPF